MLTVTADDPFAPKRLTIVSDKRVTHDPFRITVEVAGETQVYAGDKTTTAPVTVRDSRGLTWQPITDDGVTAVYGLAS